MMFGISNFVVKDYTVNVNKLNFAITIHRDHDKISIYALAAPVSE